MTDRSSRIVKKFQANFYPSPPSIIRIAITLGNHPTTLLWSHHQRLQWLNYMESVVKLPPLGIPLSKQTTIRSRSISADNKLTNSNVDIEEENCNPIDSFIVAKEGLQVIAPWLVVESHIHKG